MGADDVEVVRGGAAPEEIAAVVAVIAAMGQRASVGCGSVVRGPVSGEPTGYAAWRRTRLAALRSSDGRPQRDGRPLC
jgi:hypothetical protein